MTPIPITVYQTEAAGPVGRGDPTQGFIGDMRAALQSIRKEASVLPDQLQANFGTFMASMAVTLQGVPAILAGYEVDEIELALELTVSGEIRLIAGGGIEGKAGITLTLKRPKPSVAVPLVAAVPATPG